MQRREFTGLAMAALAGAAAPTKPQFRDDGRRVHVAIGGQPVTTLHYGPEWDKPFLHPLRTPSGIVISRGFPVEKRGGESEDHTWHRGLWWGHGDISGQDFWREMPDRKTAKLVPTGPPKLAESARLRVALQPVERPALGHVDLEFRFGAVRAAFLIDARIEVYADQALVFGDTDDGGFGMRLADAFRQDRGATLLNSGGMTGTENIWGRNAKWVDYSAAAGGKLCGAAMFDHPSNLRHPTGWHARPYALCAANPFAAGSFAKDKSQRGRYTLDAGGTLTFRYRILLHDGDASQFGVAQEFERFARP